MLYDTDDVLPSTKNKIREILGKFRIKPDEMWEFINKKKLISEDTIVPSMDVYIDAASKSRRAGRRKNTPVIASNQNEDIEFPTIASAVLSGYSKSCIAKAIAYNRVHKGYRWRWKNN